MLTDFGFYMLRHPSGPVSQLQTFHQQAQELSWEKLLADWFSNEKVREAIYIASPAFYDRCLFWIDNGVLNEKEQLLNTLYKYLIRSTTRCTPYGLFSNVAIGKFGVTSQISISAAGKACNVVNLDIKMLEHISNWLICQSIVRRDAILTPNSSGYSVGSEFRFVGKSHVHEKTEYHINSIQNNADLMLVMNLASDGVTSHELERELINSGFHKEDALETITFLIDNGILQHEFEPTVTGPDYIDGLIYKLSSRQIPQNILKKIEYFKKVINKKENLIQASLGVKKQLDKLGPVSSGSSLFKIDGSSILEKNQLNSKLIREILDMVQSLMPLSFQSGSKSLDSFKSKFSERYHDEEVPLCLALDTEMGIGFAEDSIFGVGYTPLIDDLNLPFTETDKEGKPRWWNQFILQKFSDSLKNNSKEIRLTDNDLQFIEREARLSKSNSTAHTFYIFGNLVSSSLEDADKGEFLFNLLACQGPSAVNMLSRFARGNSELAENLASCTRSEEKHHREAILAEIVHRPDDRSGNIMYRPNLYRYEIPYLGLSSVSQEYQITIEDLMVSIRNNQIVLRSKRLNKRILPRHSNVHNYRHGLPIYHFLCELQQQDSALNIVWDWDILKEQSYLPRVVYKKIIISRRTWLLTSGDFTGMTTADLRAFLIDRGIPSEFVIASSDNELYITSKLDVSLILLLQALQKEKSVRLKEFLATEANCPISNGSQYFNGEFVIPVSNSNAPGVQGFSRQDDVTTQRNYLAGSEWLYLKIYGGAQSIEDLLLGTLFPIIKLLIFEKTISHFFFVRYNDPDPHLRLRFKGAPETRFHNEVLERISREVAPFITSKKIHKLQTDTYVRELERYGWNCICHCESLFHEDSLTTLEFLEEGIYSDNELNRFTFGVRKVNQLFVDARFSPEECYHFLNKLRESFFNEFNGDKMLRKNLNRSYQQHKVIAGDIGAFQPFESENHQKTLLDTLRNSLGDRRKFDEVLSSVIHMSINRLFTTKQRAYELMLYNYLFKSYQALIARKFNSKKVSAQNHG